MTVNAKPPTIPLNDLAAQQARIRDRIDLAVARVLDHGSYILGPEVKALETGLREFCGASHAITCANGTDALQIALIAKGIGPGDAVFCPAFTFSATPEVIALLGATPIFVDVREDTFNIDPEKLDQAIEFARQNGLAPRVVMAVDLFGQPTDYASIQAVAAKHGLWLLADAAQSFGATDRGAAVGTLGQITTTSFFPAKPLGCYGDGGAIFTDDDALAQVCESIRVHGKGTDKYDNVRYGLNSRLDTVQAAILLEKLAIFPEEIVSRQAIAQRYRDRLDGVDDLILPSVRPEATSVWAQFVVRVREGKRDWLASELRSKGIATAVYYPKPLHKQTAYRHFPFAAGSLETSERLCEEVLALPMHPYLAEETQDYICGAVDAALAG